MQSVIQSTTIKISVVIIAALVLLYLVIAEFYWDKEVAKRQYELLSAAFLAEKQIEANYEAVERLKNGLNQSPQDRISAIRSYIFKPGSLSQKTEMEIGYYDLALKTGITAKADHEIELSMQINPEIICTQLKSSSGPEFFSNADAIRFLDKGMIAVAVPVVHQGEMAGYTWASMRLGHVVFNSWPPYCRILILNLLLWIIILLMIKRFISKIRFSLDSFSEMVAAHRVEEIKELKHLPELEPVLERIKDHLVKLQELNSQLELSNDKLMMIMEGITDAFFSLDCDYRFTFMNEETNKVLMAPDTDLLGRNIFELFNDKLDSSTKTNLKKAMEEKTMINWEAENSAGKHYEYHAYPFKQGLTVFVRDKTEDRKRDNEIQRLERLNLIGQMAAGISHEIRNPLTTVRGFLQMMQGRPDTTKNKEYMDLMISEIDRANEIITDFLSLSKISSDGIRLENLNEIIMRIYPMLQADAFNSDKDIVLDLNDIPKLGVNDSEIKQLILNLVRNGLEETPKKGFVTIRTFCNDKHVVLSIIDKGKGIPQNVQENMGTPFITTKESGTGLGQAISICIARRHNAKFDFVTSEKGTTFFICFPINKYLTD